MVAARRAAAAVRRVVGVLGELQDDAIGAGVGGWLGGFCKVF